MTFVSIGSPGMGSTVEWVTVGFVPLLGTGLIDIGTLVMLRGETLDTLLILNPKNTTGCLTSKRIDALYAGSTAQTWTIISVWTTITTPVKFVDFCVLRAIEP